MPSTLDRTVGISLRSVCPEARFFGGSDLRVTSCCSRANDCLPGDLFVAVTDVDVDGHDEIQEAVRRGASGVLAESLMPAPVPVCVVPDSREAFGHLCQRLAGNPTEVMHTVGVTGTNGKTTTSTLIASVLRAAKMRTGFMTTLLHSDSEQTRGATRTTPSPPDMAQWLMRMRNNDCSHAVVELSSRALAQRRTAGMQFDAAVITNLRRDHIDYHGSLVNYRSAKARLLEQLKPHGFAVVNADDAGSQLLAGKMTCPAITFGMREPAEIMGSVIERHPGEQTFLISAGNETVPVRTRMIGDHHVMNCLAAAAVGLVFGADLTAIARGLEAIERVPQRLDAIHCGQSYGVYVDCADRADRLTSSLQAVRQVTHGRLICVFGSDDDGPREERPLLGRVLERHADLGVLTSGPGGNAEPLKVIHEYLDGYDRVARGHVMPNRSRAILWALGQAKPGDSVLIAGSERRGLTECGQQEKPGDITLARDWLYQSGADEGIRLHRIA